MAIFRDLFQKKNGVFDDGKYGTFHTIMHLPLFAKARQAAFLNFLRKIPRVLI